MITGIEKGRWLIRIIETIEGKKIYVKDLKENIPEYIKEFLRAIHEHNAKDE